MSLAASPLRVTKGQREQLEAWSRSRVVPHRQVLRARIVLMAADGVANQVIAERLGTSRPSVLKWRARFEDAGMDGLEEAEGRGPKPTYGQDFVEQVIATALRPPADGSTHWSTRSLAKQVGLATPRCIGSCKTPASGPISPGPSSTGAIRSWRRRSRTSWACIGTRPRAPSC